LVQQLAEGRTQHLIWFNSRARVVKIFSLCARLSPWLLPHPPVFAFYSIPLSSGSYHLRLPSTSSVKRTKSTMPNFGNQMWPYSNERELTRWSKPVAKKPHSRRLVVASPKPTRIHEGSHWLSLLNPATRCKSLCQVSMHAIPRVDPRVDHSQEVPITNCP
jgi:hypothetical protein